MFVAVGCVIVVVVVDALVRSCLLLLFDVRCCLLLLSLVRYLLYVVVC